MLTDGSVTGAGDCQVDSQVVGDNTGLLLLRSRHSGHWSH